MSGHHLLQMHGVMTATLQQATNTGAGTRSAGRPTNQGARTKVAFLGIPGFFLVTLAFWLLRQRTRLPAATGSTLDDSQSDLALSFHLPHFFASRMRQQKSLGFLKFVLDAKNIRLED